jgi:hypothetical protein
MQVVTLVDDLDKESTADETVKFSLDGTAMEIDLSGVHAEQLREILGTYITAGRLTGGKKPARKATVLTGVTVKPASNGNGRGGTYPTADVRAWAIGQNIPGVKAKGRVSADVYDRYHASLNGS